MPRLKALLVVLVFAWLLLEAMLLAYRFAAGRRAGRSGPHGEGQPEPPPERLYASDGEMALPGEPAIGLVAMAGDVLCAATPGALLFQDARGELLRRVPLPEAALSAADAGNGAVLVATAGGLLTVAADGTVADRRPLPHPDAKLTALAVAGGRVFTSEPSRRRVHMQAPGRDDWQLLPAQPDPAFGGFAPGSAGLDLAADGNAVWIANPARRRVERFDVGGRYVESASLGARGDGPSPFDGLQNPAHVAALPDGALATAEEQPARIRLWSASGELLGTAVGPESLPGGIRDLAAASGRLFVLDAASGNVIAFRPRPATTQPY